MRRLLYLFVIYNLSLIISFAQQMKPCGTSVLARRHGCSEVRSKTSGVRRQESGPSVFLGEKRSLIILVSFPDIPFKDDYIHVWNDIANQEGYADHGAYGSIRDYFHDQSYGQFQLTFDVVGPVVAEHDHAYYGTNKDWGEPTGWFDQNVGELVEEVCRGVSDKVRFADYDWNDDGEVEQVFLLYAGHGENDYWSTDSTVIWPHMATLVDDWGYENGLMIQDIRINTYVCSNEVNRRGQLVGIGTFCHEFSHSLGLPDMYNTENGSTVLGIYDLMDQGCYNGNSWCPVGYSSYERYACGWLMPTATEILPEEDDMSFLDMYPDARIYYDNSGGNDYYLIEKRQKTGWDTFLPSEGLLFWHIDYDEMAWADNTVNNDSEHLRVERIPVSVFSLDIRDMMISADNPVVAIYDLHGCRYSLETLLESSESTRLYLVRYSDGTIKKVFR